MMLRTFGTFARRVLPILARAQGRLLRNETSANDEHTTFFLSLGRDGREKFSEISSPFNRPIE
jgi:hypothetical protein